MNFDENKIVSGKILKPSTSAEVPAISRATNILIWTMLFSNIILLIYYLIYVPKIFLGDIFRINGFTILIWMTVLFFSAIVSTFSNQYLLGFKYHGKFSALALAFTVSVMFLVMSNHIAAIILSWLAMGIFMAQLIGVDSRWGEAQEASRFAQKFFLAGTIFLATGLIILAHFTNFYTLSKIFEAIPNVPKYALLLAALCIITAAMVQSAIYPFHKWLLSAMTAPTPASALMHAGFVNGSGILLAMVSTVLIASNTLWLLFIIGGLTAVIAQFTKLLQVNVKQKLACSTIAQMGFMIMQCGLGFFNAAVAHLVLHGFYKAYLFLSSGEEIAYNAPQKPHQITIKPLQAIIVLIFGIAGAILFAFLTGKTSFNDSSVFLTLIVAITVGQVTYNIVKQETLSIVQRFFMPIGLFIIGIVSYALLYNGITFLMTDMPMTEVPQPISAIQIVFGIIFLIGFFIMKLGIYRKVPWLYVKLLNDSQPFNQTILKYKNAK